MDMGRASCSPDTWLDGQVRDLLRHYREADAVDAETVATAERHIENGMPEQALGELVDGVDP